MRVCPSIALSLLCIASAAGHRHPTLAFLPPIHGSHAVGAPSPLSPSVGFTGRNVLSAATTAFPSDVNIDDYVDVDVDAGERPTRVCVVGGGFGGVNAALTLSSLWSSSLPPSPDGNGKDDGVVAEGDSSNLEITLIDPKERFVFLPLLYELCVGDADLDEVAPTYDSLLSTGETVRVKRAAKIEHVRGSVTGIDVDENCVYYDTTDGTDGGTGEERYVYDALVISSGMEADPSVVPGAEELATTFHTIEDCYDVRRQLNLIKGERGGLDDGERRRLPPLNVVVIGGSYSGVELALNVKEELDESNVGDVNVTLVHRGSDILPFASQFNKDSAKKRLKQAGVQVLTGASVTGVTVADAAADQSPSQLSPSDDFVAEVQPRKAVHVRRRTSPAYSAETETSTIEETLPADLLLWTAGSSPPSPEANGALNCSLDRDAGGRILVGRSLRASRRNGTGGSADDDGGSISNVFAIGDAARVVVASEGDSASGQRRFPATAQVAIQQAPVAAYNVLATLRNAKAAASGDETRSGGGPPRREKLLPFRYVELGEMMTLGSDDATIDSLGGLVKIDGPAASALRRIIYGVRMPTQRQRLTALTGSAPKLVRSRVAGTKLKLRRDKGEKK